MKRPDHKHVVRLAATLLLVAGWDTGCGGINASIPVSTLMLLQNDPAPPATIFSTGPGLAVNNASIAGP